MKKKTKERLLLASIFINIFSLIINAICIGGTISRKIEGAYYDHQLNFMPSDPENVDPDQWPDLGNVERPEREVWQDRAPWVWEGNRMGEVGGGKVDSL